MSEAARRNGQPCARCGMKSGAHDWRNPHPRACTEWVTAAELREDRQRAHDEMMHGWMIDPDMEAKG